jgi:AcrR family transcriptional regulator
VPEECWQALLVRKKTAASPLPRPYGGQSKEEREHARKERLLKAGLDLFGREGYAATSIERICALAGVTARHFYEHFASRETLLRAVYDEIVADVQRQVVQALADEPADVSKRISRAVEVLVHAYLDDPRRARIAFIEIVGVSAEMERHRRGVLHAFAFVVQAQAEALAEEGRIPPRDFSLSSIALVGAVIELMVEWLHRRSERPLDALIEEIVSFFTAVIAGAGRTPARPKRRRVRP